MAKKEKRYKVIGASYEALGVTELYSKNKKKSPNEILASSLSNSNLSHNTVAQIANSKIDVSWLPLAAKEYNISPKLEDYIVSAVPLITSDIPNRNLQEMSTKELFRFHPRFGKVAYQTFVGKPTHINHQNTDITKAKGVNFDSIIVPIPKYNLYKIIVLSGFDRTKDNILAKSIADKKRKYFSMGAWIDQFVCSVCGTDAGIPRCNCFKNYGKGNITPKRELIYQECIGIDFFENSSVDDPADWTAEGNDVIALR